jgi:hypothetical protein
MTTQQDIVLTPTEGSSGAWAALEAGVYAATVQDIEDVGISDRFPADGPRLKFTFALTDELDDSNAPVTLYKWCSQKMTTGEKPSNLWKWAEALGSAPQKGVPFAVSQLRGKACQVVVEIKGVGDDARPNISSILPAKAGKRAPLAQRVAAPEPDAEAVGPCVVCDATGTQYTDKGKPVCAAHAGI